MHRIAAATAHHDYTVDVVWEDGSASVVSFAEFVGRGVCTPMKDGVFFTGKMTVADDGFVLAWPGQIEFSADSLWERRRIR